MKLESRRERELRLRRQKRSSMMGIIATFLVVFVIGIFAWVGKESLESKNREYESQKAYLEQQIKEQESRREELLEYQKYVKTKKFAEEVAKSRFGLIYPDELIIKKENK